MKILAKIQMEGQKEKSKERKCQCPSLSWCQRKSKNPRSTFKIRKVENDGGRPLGFEIPSTASSEVSYIQAEPRPERSGFWFRRLQSQGEVKCLWSEQKDTADVKHRKMTVGPGFSFLQRNSSNPLIAEVPKAPWIPNGSKTPTFHENSANCAKIHKMADF